MIYGLAILTGLTIYAKYQSCDPLSEDKTLRLDQLVPFFVIDIGRNIPGIPGFFVAAGLSAGLGAMSSIFNAVSGVIYNDIICKIFNKKFKDNTGKNILKIIIILVGFACIGVSYVFKRSKEMFSFAIGTFAVLNGPILGVVILGIVFAKATANVRQLNNFCYNI